MLLFATRKVKNAILPTLKIDYVYGMFLATIRISGHAGRSMMIALVNGTFAILSML